MLRSLLARSTVVSRASHWKPTSAPLSSSFLSTTTLSSSFSTATPTTTTKPKKFKKATKRAQHIINQLEEEQVAKCKVGRENWPVFKPGDAIQVRYKVNKSRARVQQMRGIVLARKNRGMGSSFRLHNIIAGTPFEINFPLHSPLIEDIQMIQKSFIHKGNKRMKRAKLYYLRDELPSKITVSEKFTVQDSVEGASKVVENK